jgi:hypothetical protein
MIKKLFPLCQKMINRLFSLGKMSQLNLQEWSSSSFFLDAFYTCVIDESYSRWKISNENITESFWLGTKKNRIQFLPKEKQRMKIIFFSCLLLTYINIWEKKEYLSAWAVESYIR